MSAPLIRALQLDHPNLRRAPGCVPPLPMVPGLRAFLVVGEGRFLGRDYAVGDVLVCRGEPRSGHATVLEARHGRPRLGSVLGQRLVGDAGEACHPARWRAVGELWAVYRRGVSGWSMLPAAEGAELLAAAVPPAAARRRRPRPRREDARQQGQLQLFAA